MLLATAALHMLFAVRAVNGNASTALNVTLVVILVPLSVALWALVLNADRVVYVRPELIEDIRADLAERRAG